MCLGKLELMPFPSFYNLGKLKEQPYLVLFANSNLTFNLKAYMILK